VDIPRDVAPNAAITFAGDAEARASSSAPRR
jgi:hypothetical protein